MNKIQLTFFSDPGHGWMATPVSLIKELNLAGVISPYSYLSPDRQVAYLEEDCDAPAVIMALKAAGRAYEVKELASASNESFIRRLQRFAA
jgi:hypothetical protein